MFTNLKKKANSFWEKMEENDKLIQSGVNPYQPWGWEKSIIEKTNQARSFCEDKKKEIIDAIKKDSNTGEHLAAKFVGKDNAKKLVDALSNGNINEEALSEVFNDMTINHMGSHCDTCSCNKDNN